MERSLTCVRPPSPSPVWRGDRFWLTALGGIGPLALAVALPAIAAVVLPSPAADRALGGGGGGSGAPRLGPAGLGGGWAAGVAA